MKQTGSQLASIGAVLISIAALAIGIIQAQIMAEQQQIMAEQQQIMAEQQKASVWPYLYVDRKIKFSKGVSDIKIYLENKGVGPAVVRNMELIFNGAMYSDVMSFLEALNTEGIEVSSDFKFFISAGSERVLRSAERQLVFQISVDSLTADQQRILSRINVNLCYCSVHEDCWGANGLVLEEESGCK